MTRTETRHIAILSVLLTPWVLMLLHAILRQQTAALPLDLPLCVLMLFALIMANTENPWHAVAACIGYLPIGCWLVTEPHASLTPADAVASFDVLAPLFALWILFITVAGGHLLQALLAKHHARDMPTSARWHTSH